MDIDTAIKCLESNTLRFVQPSEWPDKYEARFYDANYNRIIKTKQRQEKTPRLYATCFTMSSTSEPAWKIYSYGKRGTASRCVLFKINLKALRSELNQLAKQINAKVYESTVSYKSDYYISTLHFRLKNNEIQQVYKDYFYHFSRLKFLQLLSLKRDAFSYEHECRFFLIPNNQEDIKTLLIVLLTGAKLSRQ